MLKVYNTLSRKKESFRPLGRRPATGEARKKINLFVCGPTVYDFSHLGHARTYIVFDVIVKYLKEKGYDVFYLQNVTDIDDKIINRAKEKKVAPQKLASDFQKEYLKDMKSLKVDAVSKYAKATKHIKEIISQVERLLKKHYAYQTEDGIYYNISKFKRYGKLSRRTALQAEDAVSRIDEAKEKKNRGDFCLWKFSKPEEPKWKSPWGEGRPGWHIEDTAITEKHFGSRYDIHGGAKDLIFPHHEAEIAQMEAISGKKPLVKYWFHSGFLTVKGQKMSKSLGNFVTIKDFLRENPARLLRLLIIKTHYRSAIDYNERLLSQTKKELEKIDEFIYKLKNQKSTAQLSVRDPKLIKSLISRTKKEFARAMQDDFNTPEAFAAILNLVNEGNYLIAQNKVRPKDARLILKLLKKMDKIFSFIFWGKPKKEIPSSVMNSVRLREKCRKEGDWQKADDLRKKIKKLGYWVEDTKEGSKIKKI